MPFRRRYLDWATRFEATPLDPGRRGVWSFPMRRTIFRGVPVAENMLPSAYTSRHVLPNLSRRRQDVQAPARLPARLISVPLRSHVEGHAGDTAPVRLDQHRP